MEEKRRARTERRILVVVVLHSGVLESAQSLACVGRIATDSDRSPLPLTHATATHRGTGSHQAGRLLPITPPAPPPRRSQSYGFQTIARASSLSLIKRKNSVV